MTNEYEGNIVGGLGIIATNLSKALAKRNGILLTIICKGASREVSDENDSSIRIFDFPVVRSIIRLKDKNLMLYRLSDGCKHMGLQGRT